MIKELVISIVLIVAIFVGNGFTQGYTNSSIEETSKELTDLRGVINGENVDEQTAKKDIDEIHSNWDKRYEILAYYIEHDELEKVETTLTEVRSYIEQKEYSDSIAGVDKSVYLLEHIKNKGKFSLKNIF